MRTMNDFLTTGQEQQVVEAIRAAESRTRGEIRVVITSRRVWFRQRKAWKLFDQLGMRRTEHRNGALIVLFVRMRAFVIIGDEGLHAKVDAPYWKGLAERTTARLREGYRVEALTETIRSIGETMAAHWPAGDGENPDELPDAIHRE
jgi:uncharacterized membrane protein